MSLLKPRIAYKPFSYDWAHAAFLEQNRIHWLPEEVPLGDDVKDWAMKLTKEERHLLTQIFRFFTQADIEVADNYMTRFSQVFKPTEIQMMLMAFANMEGIHIHGYSLLIDTIGMPETEYGAFMEYDAMRSKHDFFSEFSVSNMSEIAKTLAGFGGFIEGMQLFSSFAILLNFPRHNKMKGMGQIVSWSVRDEAVTPDTELLTPGGWRRIDSLTKEDEVLQYDMETGASSFVHPNTIKKVFRDKSYVFEGPGFHQHTSPNHRMIIEKGGEVTECTAQDLDMDEDFSFVLSGRQEGTLKEFTSEHRELLIESFETGDYSWVEKLMDQIDASWADVFLDELSKLIKA